MLLRYWFFSCSKSYKSSISLMASLLVVACWLLKRLVICWAYVVNSSRVLIGRVWCLRNG